MLKWVMVSTTLLRYIPCQPKLPKLTRKFKTAAALVPKPEILTRDPRSRVGVVYFGSTRPAVLEALDELEAEGFRINAMRIKAFPFPPEVKAFCDAHDRIFVVEQNRDAQMRSLLILEAGVDGEKLVAATNFDGMPLTADFVRKSIRTSLGPIKVAAE